MTAMRILISVGRITMTVNGKQKSLLLKTGSRRCEMQEIEEEDYEMYPLWPMPDDIEHGKEFEQNFAENEYEKRGSIPVRK